MDDISEFVDVEQLYEEFNQDWRDAEAIEDAINMSDRFNDTLQEMEDFLNIFRNDDDDLMFEVVDSEENCDQGSSSGKKI